MVFSNSGSRQTFPKYDVSSNFLIFLITIPSSTRMCN